jgi:uncharacterized damage-inducible protein DinB
VSSPDYLRNMYAYTAWADDLVLDAASRLGEEQLRAEPGGGQGGLLATLGHMIGAQIHWLEAWRGERRGPRPGPPAGGTMAWLRERAGTSHQALDAFLDGLGADGAERIIELEPRGLRRTRWPLWMLMAHVALHSTQHRAEAAVELTRLGSSPGDLDYEHFCDVRQSVSAGSVEMMRALYGYNGWGNKRILASMAGISDEELLSPRGLSHASLGIDLMHSMLAERGWLSIWQEDAPLIELPGAASGRHLDNLSDGFARCDAAIGAFVDSLVDADLMRLRVDNADRHNPSVEAGRTIPLWDMMWHVLNHSMQHRAEAAMALTALGRSPGDVDLLDYLDGAA